MTSQSILLIKTDEERYPPPRATEVVTKVCPEPLGACESWGALGFGLGLRTS